MKVNDGTIMLPELILAANNAACPADVPELNATQNFEPTYFAIFFDYLIFNIFVFTIILFDSLSYINGNFFGKNFIIKSISPKKTLEGYLGGILFTNLFLILYL